MSAKDIFNHPDWLEYMEDLKEDWKETSNA
jgi:hypothetical protein